MHELYTYEKMQIVLCGN